MILKPNMNTPDSNMEIYIYIFVSDVYYMYTENLFKIITNFHFHSYTFFGNFFSILQKLKNTKLELCYSLIFWKRRYSLLLLPMSQLNINEYNQEYIIKYDYLGLDNSCNMKNEQITMLASSYNMMNSQLNPDIMIDR